MSLDGALSAAEVGTAVMRITDCNDIEPEAGSHPQKPADPLDAFLHELLTLDDLFASGGLRVTDTVTGVTLLPGCCNGLEERGDWLDVLDGDGWASFGQDPFPLAERLDDGTVRLIVDAERDDSAVIELPAAELRHLLAGAERDLTDFLPDGQCISGGPRRPGQGACRTGYGGRAPSGEFITQPLATTAEILILSL